MMSVRVWTRWLWLVLTGVVCLGLAGAEFAFTEKQEASRYIGDFRKWLEADAEEVPRRDAVLCVGSSSMRMWRSIREDLAPLHVIPRGFGGSTMADVLLFQDFFLRYEARTILVYEGDNDLNSDRCTPEAFFERCKGFCEAVWALRPDTRFHFITIKPSPSRAKRWPQQQAGNALLATFAAGDDRVTVIDVATAMLGEDGKPLPHIFLKDNLHLNPEGYAIWKGVVRKALLGE
ncbi:MAG: hypothetical protein JXR77_11485 [Lentisphaeria bacterium]|nr:hypothetical protein [Lentisphaeria bacterium]